MKLRNKFKERREELGLSIVEIAKRAGVSRPTIIKYENSEENIITKVIKAYGLELKPANESEPLIKGKKIREAVRAWAEANEFEPNYRVKHWSKAFSLMSWQADIEFNSPITDLEDGKEYTIAELCGEEEEMKKLTPKQMIDLVDFLLERYQDYEDDYSMNAVNSTLKILGYEGEFIYDPLECTIKFDGVLEN